MKIERLIGILFYILNRECVSASVLAKQFGVSRRTILRDIDSLTLAGIPIYAEVGSKGGYSIHSHYKLSEKLIDHTNSEYMLLALKSLKDIYGDEKVTETYEKVKHIYALSDSKKPLEIDLSVIAENTYVTELLKLLKASIAQKVNVIFEYTTMQNKVSRVTADILHVSYKWYAWYAFGYNCDTRSFRMYKLVRMRNLTLNHVSWLQSYNIEKELELHENNRNKNDIAVVVDYPKEMQTLFQEYFPHATVISEKENRLLSELFMKSNDFMLFSILLGFGGQMRVLSPPSFALHIQNHLEQALNFYKNSDS
ncbi:helix-turn-helix transcriptional regulator [Niameybacter sp.]|uniref:helix-turn-helix transcriptional regulator n=1 Tax=Niameybacter sp. TaxID=2033640 RepID=UPI002FCBD09E